jgi:hypothetical protein
MSFLSPALLAGALFVVIPVALHLVMRRKPRHVEFPPLRLVQARQRANQRKLKLRHLLLLALRSAAIVLLALALSRPSLRGAGRQTTAPGPLTVALVFDTGPRMDLRMRNVTRLDAARTIGLELIERLPDDARIAVVGGQFGPAVFAVDRGAATDQIEQLKTAANAKPLGQSLDDAIRLMESESGAKGEIYVFSDLSRAAWPETGDHPLKNRLAELDDASICLIDVGIEKPENYGLGPLKLSGEVLARTSPLVMTCQVFASGPAGQRSVELLIDEDRQMRKRGQESVNVPEAGGEQIQFPPIALAEGLHQGRVAMVGEDGLGWDDVRYFSVEVRSAWRILVVASRAEQALFLTEAIAPEPLQQAGRNRFECVVKRPEEIETTRLDDYAAVCLLDPPPLADEAWRRLADYAGAGHGVAVFLGRAARPLEEFVTPGARTLLAGSPKRIWRETTHLAPRGYVHPALVKFGQVEGSVPWQAFPVFAHWQLDRIAPDAVEWMAYANGQPAILERPIGRGRVVTMTTPVSDPLGDPAREPWNALPASSLEPWPFVMLANEMLLYLAGRTDERLNYSAGETAIVDLPSNQRPPVVLLDTPLGDRLRQAVDPREQAIRVTTTHAVGNYRIRAGGKDAGLDRGFSVNLTGNATQIERMDPQEFDAILGKGRYRIVRDRREIERSIERGRRGRELYPWLISLVALILAGEHVVSNRFYQDKL